MRDGQPRCVCAPKCKTKNRPKRVNRHATIAQLKSHHDEMDQHSQDDDHHNDDDVADRRIYQQQMNRSGKSHSHHQSIHTDAVTATSQHDVQIFHTHNLNNRSNTKSDKIISIIAPILPSNLSSSHRHKKMQSHHQQRQQQQQKSAKSVQQSSKHALATSNKSYAKQHHPISKNHRHKLSTTKNQYSNSSLFDNNIVNINHHRRQTSVEQQFKSKFYGHDIPYPPIDSPVS